MDSLYIDTYGLIAQHTDYSLATMAHIKMDVGMVHYRGFAMLTIRKDGWLCDAILLAQSLAQQQIGSSTLLAPQFVFELQALLSALYRQ